MFTEYVIESFSPNAHFQNWQLERAGEHTEHLVCGSAGPDSGQQATRAVSRNNLYGFMKIAGSVRPLPDTDGVEVA